MNAIVGKIVSVSSGTKQRGLTRLTVRFKAAALLPERADVPAWLADQVLEVQRDVADVRELGDAGDGIALTPAESEKFLAPLVVEPATIEGKIPMAIAVTLRWWKTPAPPGFTVKALGKTIAGTFARRGKIFSASVPTKGLLADADARPIEIEIACDSLRARCAVVPAGKPALHRFLDIRGEGYRLLNPFYAIDIAANQAGGAIIGFRERGRGVDHFARTDETQKALDKVGHCDRVAIGTEDKLSKAKLEFTVRQHETGATRVEVEGVVDEGKNVRSTAAYRLFDGLPLLVLRRDARIGEGKPDEKKKEPTDSLVPVQLSFHHATTLEGDGAWGSQIVAPDGDRLGAIRACYQGDHAQKGEWFLKAGWAMVHHPLRREVTLFLLDREHPPELVIWAGNGFLTIEPAWLPRSLRPPAGVAFTLGLSAGEVGGASLDGGWVACQAPAGEKGILCIAIAKLRSAEPNAAAEFRLGREKRAAPLSMTLVEGVGDIHYAAAYFPKTDARAQLDATVAGIPSRSRP